MNLLPVIQPATSHRATQELGPCVVDGVVRWLGATIMASADPTQTGGCEARFWYTRVAGYPEPETARQGEGKKLHDEIEHYLKTGEMVLGRVALAGRRFIPERGPDLLIEHSIGDDAQIRTDCGIPIAGHSDLISPRREYITPDGDLAWDPAGTVEVIDWKSTTDFKWAKLSWQLPELVQMTTYGIWAARKFNAPYVRLSHVVFVTRGRAEARKATVLVARRDLEKRWQRLQGVVRRIVEIARARRVEDVTANLNACDAYRGCPHRGYCAAAQEDSLEDLLGPTAARELLQTEKEKTMSTNVMNIPGLAALIPGAQAPAPAAPAIDPAALAAMKAQLVAAEQPAAPAIDPRLVQAVATIERAGIGVPTLFGNAAQAWAAVKGIPHSGNVIQGTGPFATTQVLNAEQLIKIASDLAIAMQPAPVAAPAPVGLLPPDAPASDPAKAAAPVEGFAMPGATTLAQCSPPADPITLPAPIQMAGAELGVPSIPPPATAAVVAAAEEKPKKGRGRPKKEETAAPAAPAAPAALATRTEEWNTAITELEAAARPQIFVDCFMSIPATSLRPFVEQCHQILVDRFCAGAPFPDIRCADEKGPMGFGRWKGAIGSVARELVKSLAPGAYAIDTRGDELAEAVVSSTGLGAHVIARGAR